MSRSIFINNLREIEVDIAWSHWCRLGVLGQGKINKCSTDPEAIILLTSMIGKYDLRLIDVMSAWLDNYGDLVSIERLKKYIKELSAESHFETRAFDVLCNVVTQIQKPRWTPIKELLGVVQVKAEEVDQPERSRKKLEPHEKLIRNNKQLYLRLMFGVGSRADIIYYAHVVSNQEKNTFGLQISSPHITRMLHYNNSSVFRTLCDLEKAGFFVIDQKLTIGKNKVFFPNLDRNAAEFFVGMPNAFDRGFIDWLSIAKIFIQIDGLEKKILNFNEESIMKSRLNDFTNSCAALMNAACVDHKQTIASGVALNLVEVNDLENRIVLQMQSIYEFMT